MFIGGLGLIIFGILLLCYSNDEEYYKKKDWEYQEKILEEERKKNELIIKYLEKKCQEQERYIRRRFAKEGDLTLGEELIEEHIYE